MIISHNLHDVFEAADRITVLRLGQRVASAEEVRDDAAGGRARDHRRHDQPRARDGRHGGGGGMTEHDASLDPTAAVVAEPLPPVAPPGEGPARSRSRASCARWWQGVKAGELGSLPIIVGLIVIVIVFGLLDDTFLTERNFTNLLLQMVGDRDHRHRRRVRAAHRRDRPVGGLRERRGGVVMTLLLRPDDPGWPWWAAIGAALALHDRDRLRPGARDHEGRRAVVRRHAGGAPHLVGRRPHPDDPGLAGGHDQDPGRRRRRDRQRLPEPDC